MKKLLTGLALTASAFGMAACNKMNDEAENSETDSKVTDSYRIDSRHGAIEFSPEGHPDKLCVYVTGYKEGGLSCFDKPKGP
ncbi:MAG: hypothetical protein CL565_03410 [Alphaproteobacteria bacterium]|nr:hypothetical protein [Alphaproteobacteria bacterium]|tara:strand:+ start:121 stop:366 length:246 start_codon:yes stop_codon:yes gene_type:complete